MYKAKRIKFFQRLESYLSRYNHGIFFRSNPIKTGLFENEIMRGWVKIRKPSHNIFKILTWHTPSNQNIIVIKKYPENCLLLLFLKKTSLFSK